MDIGDLLEWNDKVWVVRKVDQTLGNALIESNGQRATVGVDFECKILCNPTMDWPSAQLPIHRLGRIVEVRSPSRSLVRIEEWLKLDELQQGGVIYFNPSLSLGYRDRLVAVFSRLGESDLVPIDIPSGFMSLRNKQAQAMARKKEPPKPPPGPKTHFDHLLEDD